MKDSRQVLDYGEVELRDWMGDDHAIAEAARVSNNKDDQAADEGRDANTIRYLMDNRHTTPFEMVVFKFYVKAPIFVFRQWHRHRTWSYNEVSARYTELPNEYYLPKPEYVGTQSTVNKQCRDFDEADHKRFDEISLVMGQNNQAFELYGKLLKSGWPRELARSVLPVSTYSKMYAKVDLHNLFHFIGLRNHSHAQYEIRVYAQAMLELISPIVPKAVESYERVIRQRNEFTEFLAEQRRAERDAK